MEKDVGHFFRAFFKTKSNPGLDQCGGSTGEEIWLILVVQYIQSQNLIQCLLIQKTVDQVKLAGFAQNRKRRAMLVQFSENASRLCHHIFCREFVTAADLNKYFLQILLYIFAIRCMSQYAAEQALALGKLGIRVNNVMPGSTATGMKDEFEKMAGGKEALLNETGVAHRLASPEEMAGPIVFLGSDLCSFVSGVDFCVDSADRTQKVLKIKKDVANISATNPLILKFAKRAMDKQNAK